MCDELTETVAASDQDGRGDRDRPRVGVKSVVEQEEFLRLQEQLIELRTLNYQLKEDNLKLKNDQSQSASQPSGKKPGDEQRSFGSKFLSKASAWRPNQASHNQSPPDESDADMLRSRLASQEAEFELQQQTMRQEINQLMARNMELEQQQQSVIPSAFEQQSVIPSTYQSDVSTPVPEFSENPNEEAAQLLAVAPKEWQSASNLPQEMAQLKEELDDCCAQLADMNEKYRRKQESYVQLSAEMQELKEENAAHLNAVTELEHQRTLTDGQNELNVNSGKLQFAEKELTWVTEKETLNRNIETLKVQLSETQREHQALENHLKEVETAKELLASQLDECQQELQHTKQQMDDSAGNAEKRKTLLDEMAIHLEHIQEEHKMQLQRVADKHADECEALKEELQQNKLDSLALDSLRSQLLASEQSVQTELNRRTALESDIQEGKKEIAEKKAELESAQAQLAAAAEEHELTLAAVKDEMKVLLRDREGAETELNDKLFTLEKQITDLNDLQKIELRKHKAVMKEVKRQTQQERVRADQLQQRLAELGTTCQPFSTEHRQRSPGSFENVRSEESPESNGTGGLLEGAGSVCSWHVVQANQHSPAHSYKSGSHNVGAVQNGHGQGTDDRDRASSVCSMEVLETDTVQLIAKVTTLQRDKCDLQENLRLLEHKLLVNEEQLAHKSAVIEQYIVDSTDHHAVGASHSASGSSNLAGSQSPSSARLMPSLRRVADLMKVDVSASDIRDMNSRLQLMLEETLTKNMRLQNDLDTLARQIPPAQQSTQQSLSAN